MFLSSFTVICVCCRANETGYFNTLLIMEGWNYVLSSFANTHLLFSLIFLNQEITWLQPSDWVISQEHRFFSLNFMSSHPCHPTRITRHKIRFVLFQTYWWMSVLLPGILLLYLYLFFAICFDFKLIAF